MTSNNRIRAKLRLAFLVLLLPTLVASNLLLLKQNREAKWLLSRMPWHPSPKGLIRLLENKRPWRDAYGKNYFLNQPTAKYLLIFVFQPTDCPACLEDLAVLNELRSRTAPDQLRIVAIASNTNASEIRKLIEVYGLEFPVLLDDASAAKSLLGLHETPWKILVLSGDRRIIFDMGPSLVDVERQFFLMRVLRFLHG